MDDIIEFEPDNVVFPRWKPGYSESTRGIFCGSLVPWWLAGLGILVCSAVIMRGVRWMVSKWEREGEVPQTASVLGGTPAILLSAFFGALIGEELWDWTSGLAVGIVGACGAPLVLRKASALLERWTRKKT